MMDESFERYWQDISAELREIFGSAGDDVVVTADYAAACLRMKTVPAQAALRFGELHGLTPANDG